MRLWLEACQANKVPFPYEKVFHEAIKLAIHEPSGACTRTIVSGEKISAKWCRGVYIPTIRTLSAARREISPLYSGDIRFLRQLC